MIMAKTSQNSIIMSQTHITSQTAPWLPASTPPGFNKKLRDIARCILLLLVTASILQEMHLWAACFSATAILLLKDGRASSIKNMKWMVLSIMSFVASLLSWSMRLGSNIVDEEKAYTLKISLLLMGKFIQTIWGITLGFFLLSAATASFLKICILYLPSPT